MNAAKLPLLLMMLHGARTRIWLPWRPWGPTRVSGGLGRGGTGARREGLPPLGLQHSAGVHILTDKTGAGAAAMKALGHRLGPGARCGGIRATWCSQDWVQHDSAVPVPAAACA